MNEFFQTLKNFFTKTPTEQVPQQFTEQQYQDYNPWSNSVPEQTFTPTQTDVVIPENFTPIQVDDDQAMQQIIDSGLSLIGNGPVDPNSIITPEVNPYMQAIQDLSKQEEDITQLQLAEDIKDLQESQDAKIARDIGEAVDLRNQATQFTTEQYQSYNPFTTEFDKPETNFTPIKDNSEKRLELFDSTNDLAQAYATPSGGNIKSAYDVYQPIQKQFDSIGGLDSKKLFMDSNANPENLQVDSARESFNLGFSQVVLAREETSKKLEDDYNSGNITAQQFNEGRQAIQSSYEEETVKKFQESFSGYTNDKLSYNDVVKFDETYRDLKNFQGEAQGIVVANKKKAQKNELLATFGTEEGTKRIEQLDQANAKLNALSMLQNNVDRRKLAQFTESEKYIKEMAGDKYYNLVMSQASASQQGYLSNQKEQLQFLEGMNQYGSNSAKGTEEYKKFEQQYFVYDKRNLEFTDLTVKSFAQIVDTAKNETELAGARTKAEQRAFLDFGLKYGVVSPEEYTAETNRVQNGEMLPGELRRKVTEYIVAPLKNVEVGGEKIEINSIGGRTRSVNNILSQVKAKFQMSYEPNRWYQKLAYTTQGFNQFDDEVMLPIARGVEGIFRGGDLGYFSRTGQTNQAQLYGSRDGTARAGQTMLNFFNEYGASLTDVGLLLASTFTGGGSVLAGGAKTLGSITRLNRVSALVDAGEAINTFVKSNKFLNGTLGTAKSVLMGNSDELAEGAFSLYRGSKAELSTEALGKLENAQKITSSVLEIGYDLSVNDMIINGLVQSKIPQNYTDKDLAWDIGLGLGFNALAEVYKLKGTLKGYDQGDLNGLMKDLTEEDNVLNFLRKKGLTNPSQADINSTRQVLQQTQNILIRAMEKGGDEGKRVIDMFADNMAAGEISGILRKAWNVPYGTEVTKMVTDINGKALELSKLDEQKIKALKQFIGGDSPNKLLDLKELMESQPKVTTPDIPKPQVYSEDEVTKIKDEIKARGENDDVFERTTDGYIRKENTFVDDVTGKSDPNKVSYTTDADKQVLDELTEDLDLYC